MLYRTRICYAILADPVSSILTQAPPVQTQCMLSLAAAKVTFVRELVPFESMKVPAVSYTHLTLPTTPYV